MSFVTRIYVAAVIALGCAALALYLPALAITEKFRFGAYLTMAVIAAGMKVRLPGVSGTMSVLFLFLLIGIVELSVAETLLIAVVAALVQSFWRPERPPQTVKVIFSAAGLVISVVIANSVYTAPALAGFLPLPWRLAAATFAFYVANTFTVAIVLALTEHRAILATWRDCYFWSFPYYLAGGCLAALFGHLTRSYGWQVAVLILPIVYITYRSYRLYVERLEAGRQHAEELQEAADRLNSVLESTTDCVFAAGPDGRVTYANQRAQSRLFGGANPVGAVVWEQFPQLAVGNFADTIRETLRDNAARQTEVFSPLLNAWFEVHAYPLAGGVALYLKDVTEERELREQLRHAQKVEAVGQLAGGVAHDFNNLLTIILGYGHAVAESLGETHPARNSMDEVLKAAERAAGLTQRLLAFSRKQLVQPETVDLNAIITGMEGMLRRLIGEDVVLHIELDPGIGNIRADRNQIEQIVMNLSVNARDAMPSGGDLRIATRSRTSGREAQADNGSPGAYAVLVVSDTGHGIAPAIKGRIFEPFFTTKETGRGTGLGLSVVQRIVQDNQAQISVESEPGRGTRFEVSFPIVGHTVHTPPPVAGTASPGACRTRRVLLVEDEDAVRELAVRMLTRAGYSVLPRRNGEEALRIPNHELAGLDLLVTDVVMPGISGVDLANRLLREHAQLRVLFLSGYTDHPLIQSGALSNTRHLEKPFTADQLLAKIGEICDSVPG
ncbi:MAG TPA: ATP-binding protein [Bryobacteraceae bacterium]|nr:ATP-binding protein [Bryobacteraceae bacterium]